MSSEIKELNIICIYCHAVNSLRDRKTIYNLMKNPIFNCLNCNELLEILQIENKIINKVSDSELK